MYVMTTTYNDNETTGGEINLKYDINDYVDLICANVEPGDSPDEIENALNNVIVEHKLDDHDRALIAMRMNEAGF